VIRFFNNLGEQEWISYEEFLRELEAISVEETGGSDPTLPPE
jgi:hypothetical protein